MKNLTLEIYDDCVSDVITGQREANLFLLNRAERYLNDQDDKKTITTLRQIINNIEGMKKQVAALTEPTAKPAKAPVPLANQVPALFALPLEMPSSPDLGQGGAEEEEVLAKPKRIRNRAKANAV